MARVVVIIALVLLLVLGLIHAPAPTSLLVHAAEFLVAFGTVVMAGFVYLRLWHRSDRVGEALQLAARRDAAWSESALRETVHALFDTYWTARTRGTMVPLMPALSAHHQKTIDQQARNGDRLVGRVAKLLDLRFIGLHDHLDDRRDRFEVLVRCQTDIHRVSRLGELREGSPVMAELHQRWQFVRDAGRWLLNDVRQMEVADALRSSEVVLEEGGV